MRIRVAVFPGGFNWPIWIAQEHGFFKRENVEVNLTPISGSVKQITGLVAGNYEVAHTAIDNIVAYIEGQGEVELENQPGLISFMGGDNGLLRLITKPDIQSYSELKGERLSVDALTTGYTFVLRKMLEENGLRKGDYELVPVGGVMQRWEALQRQEHAGTLLVTPFEVLARIRGFNLLGSAINVLDRYQGLVGTVSRAWAEAHEDGLVRYIGAYLSGLAWLYDPANREEAMEILLSNTNLPQEVASEVYEILVDPVRGIAPSATLDVEGVRTVLSLRSQYSETREFLMDPGKYFDLHYYDRARGAVAKPRPEAGSGS